MRLRGCSYFREQIWHNQPMSLRGCPYFSAIESKYRQVEDVCTVSQASILDVRCRSFLAENPKASNIDINSHRFLHDDTGACLRRVCSAALRRASIGSTIKVPFIVPICREMYVVYTRKFQHCKPFCADTTSHRSPLFQLIILPPTGFEPATFGSSAEAFNRVSYCGATNHSFKVCKWTVARQHYCDFFGVYSWMYSVSVKVVGWRSPTFRGADSDTCLYSRVFCGWYIKSTGSGEDRTRDLLRVKQTW